MAERREEVAINRVLETWREVVLEASANQLTRAATTNTTTSRLEERLYVSKLGYPKKQAAGCQEVSTPVP